MGSFTIHCQCGEVLTVPEGAIDVEGICARCGRPITIGKKLKRRRSRPNRPLPDRYNRGLRPAFGRRQRDDFDGAPGPAPKDNTQMLITIAVIGGLALLLIILIIVAAS